MAGRARECRCSDQTLPAGKHLRIGAEFAAYALLLMPIIALVLSTLFEGYHWTTNAQVGIALVLAVMMILCFFMMRNRRGIGMCCLGPRIIEKYHTRDSDSAIEILEKRLELKETYR